MPVPVTGNQGGPQSRGPDKNVVNAAGTVVFN